MKILNYNISPLGQDLGYVEQDLGDCEMIIRPKNGGREFSLMVHGGQIVIGGKWNNLGFIGVEMSTSLIVLEVENES